MSSPIKLHVPGAAQSRIADAPDPGRLPVPAFSRKSDLQGAERMPAKAPAVAQSDRAMASGGPASLQQATYRALVAQGRNALDIWENRPLGGHAVAPPDLRPFPGVRQVTEPIWVVNKNETGRLQISSVAYPPVPPQLCVIPSRDGASFTLNGEKLSESSSYADLQLAKALVQCIERDQHRSASALQ